MSGTLTARYSHFESRPLRIFHLKIKFPLLDQPFVTSLTISFSVYSTLLLCPSPLYIFFRELSLRLSSPGARIPSKYCESSPAAIFLPYSEFS